MKVACQSRTKSSTSHAGEDIINILITCPFFQNLSSESSLSFDHIQIVESMYEDSVVFLTELKTCSYCIIEGGSHKLDGEPLTSMPLDVVHF